MKYLMIRAFLITLLTLVPVQAVLWAQILQPPSDVRNVVATAKDKAVLLNWDAATDPDGVVVRYMVYYGATAVTDEGGSYDQEIDTQSDDTTFEVNNLVNNDTYYFGVTAVDEQGNESELYSVEVSATPKASSSAVMSDNGSPILQNAVHTAPNKILVVMSEPVFLDDPKDAFELTEDATGSKIAILNALTNSEQVTLIVDPSLLEVDEIYRVTATTGVTDADGNPVSSGIVDSVEFRAQANFASEPEEDEFEEEEEPLLVEPALEDEPVVVTPKLTTPDDFGSFFLDNEGGNSDTANFLDGLLSPDNLINNLDTADLAVPNFEPITNVDSDVNLSSAPDLIPPQDARNLNVDTTTYQTGKVKITWLPALDLKNDIKDQVLYTRVGLGAWDSGLSLGKEISEASISVQPNHNYQIRLVTVDESGNESFGAPFDFSTTLSQSGGGQGTVIALSVMAVLGFFFLFAGGRRA